MTTGFLSAERGGAGTIGTRRNSLHQFADFFNRRG
jgi:hypothetical protein